MRQYLVLPHARYAVRANLCWQFSTKREATTNIVAVAVFSAVGADVGIFEADLPRGAWIRSTGASGFVAGLTAVAEHAVVTVGVDCAFVTHVGFFVAAESAKRSLRRSADSVKTEQLGGAEQAVVGAVRSLEALNASAFIFDANRCTRRADIVAGQTFAVAADLLAVAEQTVVALGVILTRRLGDAVVYRERDVVDRARSKQRDSFADSAESFSANFRSIES